MQVPDAVDGHSFLVGSSGSAKLDKQFDEIALCLRHPNEQQSNGPSYIGLSVVETVQQSSHNRACRLGKMSQNISNGPVILTLRIVQRCNQCCSKFSRVGSERNQRIHRGADLWFIRLFKIGDQRSDLIGGIHIMCLIGLNRLA